jgi:hypothetical protein
MPEALVALGVRPDTLTPAERARLDVDGYLPFPGLLDRGGLATLRDRVEALVRNWWTIIRRKGPDLGLEKLLAGNIVKPTRQKFLFVS